MCGFMNKLGSLAATLYHSITEIFRICSYSYSNQYEFLLTMKTALDEFICMARITESLKESSGEQSFIIWGVRTAAQL